MTCIVVFHLQVRERWIVNVVVQILRFPFLFAVRWQFLARWVMAWRRKRQDTAFFVWNFWKFNSCERTGCLCHCRCITYIKTAKMTGIWQTKNTENFSQVQRDGDLHQFESIQNCGRWRAGVMPWRGHRIAMVVLTFPERWLHISLPETQVFPVDCPASFKNVDNPKLIPTRPRNIPQIP